MRALAACTLAALAACYSPTIEDGQYSCRDDNGCPEGFRCQCMSSCVRNPIPASECPPAVGEPCTNSAVAGTRAAGDPGLADIAFCPAAWVNPGVNNTVACGRLAGPDGHQTTNTSVPCSAGDNCGMGWHVCSGEAEVRSKGLTAAACDDNGKLPANSFFATIQSTPPTSLSCGSPGAFTVLGCGTIGPSPSCEILKRAINGCGMLPDGWVCPGQFSTPFTSIRRLDVSRPGGILCCKD